MKQLYDQLDSKIKALDFNALNSGFTPYPFALYNATHFFYEDKEYPITDQFRGNTTIHYEDKYIAIWNLDFTKDLDIDSLSAGIVHEMYHAHQMTHEQSDYPDDFKILTEGISKPYIYYLSLECDLLVKSVKIYDSESRIALLEEVLKIRQARQSLQPSLFEQEINLENFEGIAEFVSYLALATLSVDQANHRLNQYVETLTEKKYLTHLRQLTYCKSVLFLQLIKTLNVPFINISQTSKPNYYLASRTLFDTSTPLIPVCDEEMAFVDDIYRDLNHKSRLKIETFMNTTPKLYTKKGQICGYDPINMTKYEDKILCTHFIAIDFGKGPEFINGPVLLQVDHNEAMSVHNYWVVLPE